MTGTTHRPQRQWQRIELSQSQYVAGELPLPDWPGGQHDVRLPDGSTASIVVSAGTTSSLKTFVWDRLGPGATVETLRPDGLPGNIRIPVRVAGFARGTPTRAFESGGDDVRGLCDAALDRIGLPARFETLWAYLAFKGSDIEPGELRRHLKDWYFVSDDLIDVEPINGLADFHSASIWDGDGWDDPEAVALDELSPREAPHLPRVWGKRKSSIFDGLEQHLDDIRHSLLSAERERELGRAIAAAQEAEVELHRDEADHDRKMELGLTIRRGDEAREEFVTQNLRLVVRIAARYRRMAQGSILELADLIQEGYLGLRRAVEKYDPTRGTRFSTYATWWVRQAVTRSIADRSHTIRLSVHVFERAGKVKGTARELMVQLGRDPSSSEIAAKLGIDPGEVDELLRLDQPTLSIDDPRQMLDTEAADDTVEDYPCAIATSVMFAVNMRSLLDTLSDREAKVIALRFGFYDGVPRTLEEIGQEFNVTRERIRQIEKKALAKLYRPAHRRRLFHFIEMDWAPLRGPSGDSA